MENSLKEQVISTIENNFPGLRVAERVRHKTSKIVLFLYPDERDVNTKNLVHDISRIIYPEKASVHSLQYMYIRSEFNSLRLNYSHGSYYYYYYWGLLKSRIQIIQLFAIISCIAYT